jgi:hypothetical protein
MVTGLSTDKWISFIDAKQLLACGLAHSVQPPGLDEEELSLSGWQEKCQLEMKAEAEARREANGNVGDPLEYPFPPSDIGGNPMLTVATLEANRASWTPSCGKLNAKATALINVQREKVQKLRSAGDLIVTDWRAGHLQIKGRKVGGSTGEHEVIDPTVTRLGDLDFRDVWDKDTGFRTDMYVVKAHGGYTTDKRHLYEDVVTDRAEPIKLAQSSGADTLNKELATEPACTQLPSLSPDGMPGLADPKVNPAKATNLGVGSVPKAKNKARAQIMVLQAIAALGLEQIARELPDKELQRRIKPWFSDQEKETPCIKTIRRAIGKDA